MGIRKTASGKYQGRITYKGKPYSTESFTKKTDAVKAEANLRIELHEGVHVQKDVGSITFDEWAVKVIQRRDVKEQTRANYLRDLRLHLSPTFGHNELRHITPTMVDDWFYSQPEIPARKNRYNVLSLVMTQAVRKREITFNPCLVEGARKDLTPERPLLSKEEFRRILVASTEEDRLLWTVLMIGGLRIGEGLALNRTDLDLKTGVLDISKQWIQQHARVEEGTKNGETRDVSLPTWLVDELKAHWKKKNPGIGEIPRAARAKDGEQVAGRPRTALSPEKIRKVQQYRVKGRPVNEIATLTGMSRASVYRALHDS
ncbi:hypothetical protein WDJ51_05685 [Rathayibacter sp. YIM 133350]|uniref:hypothetical protein n=1 Tax=Rathayibacter sp. YIM 133350 TaxID=3131992 RepID=UPI00307E967D